MRARAASKPGALEERDAMDRRTFLKTAGAVGGTSLAACVSGKAADATAGASVDDSFGILIDLTRCVGCRTCEYACAEANGLPEPDTGDPETEGPARRTSDKQWTAVSDHQTSRGEVHLKHQCMHCLEPACASACLTKALLKTKEGPVIWRPDKCMGCRYCMMSCPFDIPKFEYHSATPRIMKCQLCWKRLREGEVPACVDNCPNEALTFGRRAELLEIARQRIYENPEDYHHHIYGEHEAGGTAVLYISPVPFEELDLPSNLGDKPFPEYTHDFLTAVPVVLTVWPAFLLSLWRATARTDRRENGQERKSSDAGEK